MWVPLRTKHCPSREREREGGEAARSRAPRGWEDDEAGSPGRWPAARGLPGRAAVGATVARAQLAGAQLPGHGRRGVARRSRKIGS